MKAVTRIGEYDVNKYVQYIKKNPDVMDTILNLYNSFDLNGMLSLIEDLDLNNPYQKSKLDHKWYMKYKKEIEQALNEDQEFLETSENKYLEDEYTKKIYNKSANKYDEIWDGVFAYELRGEVVDWLEVLPNEKILEIGVGTGNNIKYFPNDVDLIGIDYAGEMLDIAKNKAIQLDKKVKFMQMNAKKLNFKDDSFDKVLCFYSLCSMSAPGNVLREIYRVIKDKGRLVVFDVIKSDIDEIALIQYLFRSIARKFGAIYLEFSPPYVITYDSYLDLFSILDGSHFKLEKSKYMDPLRTIALLTFTINK